MLGLLQKDIRLLRPLGKMTMLLVVFCSIMTFFSSNYVFNMSYVALIAASIGSSTINYDRMNNGEVFLMTLPVSRKQYVIGKYVFCISVGMIGFFFSLFCSVVTILKAGRHVPKEEFLLYAALSFGVMLLLTSYMLPVIYKYGAEKGKIILIGGVLLITFGVAFVTEQAEKGIMSMEAVLRAAERLGTAGIGIIVVAGAVILCLISVAVSVRIMEKKEY